MSEYPVPYIDSSVFNPYYFEYLNANITIEQGDHRYVKLYGNSNIIGNININGNLIVNGNSITNSSNANINILLGNIATANIGNLSVIYSSNLSNLIASIANIQTANINNEFINGNLNVGGNINGNISITNLSLTGNLSATNISATTGNITTANIINQWITGNLFIGGNLSTIQSNVTTSNINNLSVIGNINANKCIITTANITTANISDGFTAMGNLIVVGNISSNNANINYSNIQGSSATTPPFVVNDTAGASSGATRIWGDVLNQNLQANSVMQLNIGKNKNHEFQYCTLRFMNDDNNRANNRVGLGLGVVGNVVSINGYANITTPGSITSNNMINSGNSTITGNLTANVINGTTMFITSTSNISTLNSNNIINVQIPNGILSTTTANYMVNLNNQWGSETNRSYPLINAQWGSASGNTRVYQQYGKYDPAMVYSGLNFNGTDASLDNYAFYGLGGPMSWTANLMTITLHGNVSHPRHTTIKESITSNGSINLGNSTITGNISANIAKFNSANINGNLWINNSANANSIAQFYVGSDNIIYHTPQEIDMYCTMIPRTGGNAASIVEIYPGTSIYGWEYTNNATKELSMTCQLNHQWANIIHPNVEPHIHYILGNNDTGNIEFQMSYWWTNIGSGNITGTTNITTLKAGSGTAWMHDLVSFANVSGAGKGLSSIFGASLKRVGGSGNDTYTGSVYVVSVDLHCFVDKFGFDAGT